MDTRMENNYNNKRNAASLPCSSSEREREKDTHISNSLSVFLRCNDIFAYLYSYVSPDITLIPPHTCVSLW